MSLGNLEFKYKLYFSEDFKIFFEFVFVYMGIEVLYCSILLIFFIFDFWFGIGLDEVGFFFEFC